MTERLLAIDPGDDRTHSNMGWARFWGGYFVDAGEAHPRAILSHILGADTIVFEHPEFYRQRFSKGDPNTSLVPLVQQIGIIKGLAWGNNVEPKFVEVFPKTWKGQVKDKSIVHNRVETLWTIRDCKPPPKTMHNAWDAISLGFWALKRYTPTAVYEARQRRPPPR